LQLAERAFVGADVGNCIGPVAIVDGPAQRLQVVHCNDAARVAGIAPGIKLAAAQALAHQLIAIERNREREWDALAELAAWAYQFSSQIVVQVDGLLLEIGGSERLFGGRGALVRTIAAGLSELGYRGAFAQAATPRAARIHALAKSGGRDSAALTGLPLALLEWDADTTATLKKLGLVTIGDVLALPRDAFGKRFGAARLDDLDRIFGNRPDPQPAYEPPQHFAVRLELPADVADTAQLMWPARRLLASLEGFLRGRNAGATELVFSATHSQRRTQLLAPTEIRLALAVPERDALRLAALLEERLTRVILPAPVLTLALAVERLQAFAAVNGSLLPQPAGTGVDWLKLAETLHARLGSERVFQLQAVDDHRPECAWRAVPLAIEVADVPAALPAAPRPLLLLPTPQPLPMHDETPIYREPLTLITGPERIECGWWDTGRHAQTVHRDYFIARNRRGQLLWIFRELAAPRGWFLHGLFA
jgi:protein ImuB